MALLESKVNFHLISLSFWLHFGSILNPFGAPFCSFWTIGGSLGCLGGPLGRLGRQRVRRDDLGSEELVRWTPLGCHKATPKWLQQLMEKHWNICMIFYVIFRVPWGRPWGSKIAYFWLQTTLEISMIFQCDFGGFLGSMTGARMEPK